MHLVIGLGNPGVKHADTRHNVGFSVVDRLAERDGALADRKQLGALMCRVRLEGTDAVLAKPQSYMNCSGQPGVSLRGFYKVNNDAIIVIHDDLELPFGTVKVKVGGGHAGHNGLRDLTAKMGADFVRIRVGIGRPPAGWNVADFVLASWTEGERAQLEDLVDAAAEAVVWTMSKGARSAVNEWNRRAKESLGAASA